MSIKLKNEVFKNGFVVALSGLMNKIEFDGDVAWEMVLFKNETSKQEEAYKELRESNMKDYIDLRNKFISELGNNGRIEPDSEAAAKFNSNVELKESQDKAEKLMKALNDKETEYKYDKIQLTKEELKKVKLLPAILWSLQPALDVR